MLRAYRVAVESRTRVVLSGLRPADLDEIVDAAHIHWLIGADDAVTERARMQLDDWDSGTKGAYFCDLAVAHQWQHSGEALTIWSLCSLMRGGIHERAAVLADTVHAHK